MKSLATQDWWDKHNEATRFEIAQSWDSVRKWIEHFVPRGSGKAFEIGCYPGRYLAVLGEMGYELSGVDLSPGTSTHLVQWLAGKGYRVGAIQEADYFNCAIEPSYDVVMSFGFIEHFTDWSSVLQRHLSHLKPGGLMVVSCPNFRGSCQLALRRWLDPENLKRHNIDAMDPQAWAADMEGRSAEIVWKGHFGVFGFHVEPQRRSILQRACVRGLEVASPGLRRLLPDSPRWSPYAGIVVRKH